MPTRDETAVEYLHRRDIEGALSYLRNAMKKPSTVATVKGKFYTKYGQPPGYNEAIARLQAAVNATPEKITYNAMRVNAQFFSAL